MTNTQRGANVIITTKREIPGQLANNSVTKLVAEIKIQLFQKLL